MMLHETKIPGRRCRLRKSLQSVADDLFEFCTLCMLSYKEGRTLLCTATYFYLLNQSSTPAEIQSISSHHQLADLEVLPTWWVPGWMGDDGKFITTQSMPVMTNDA